MTMVSYWQYVLLCVVSTFALFATAIWPEPQKDIWQRSAWVMAIAGWGFISWRLWLGMFEGGDHSVSIVGAVGVTLLAAAAVLRRVPVASRP
jgi:hypothetical protein